MKKTCSVAIALGLSLFIYVFYRSEKTLINELVIPVLTLDFYTTLKASFGTSIPLSNVIIFSLPGGLWVFCVTMLAQGLYLKIKAYKIQLVFVPFVFAVGLEFCQLAHLTNGRFDLWDLIFYLGFWLAAYYTFPAKQSHQNIISPFTLHGFICLACFLSVYLAHVSR